jgi:hypothetical protein
MYEDVSSILDGDKAKASVIPELDSSLKALRRGCGEHANTDCFVPSITSLDVECQANSRFELVWKSDLVLMHEYVICAIVRVDESKRLTRKPTLKSAFHSPPPS